MEWKFGACNIVGVCVCVYVRGLPRWPSGKEPTCQCRRHERHGFDPWVGKIPWMRRGNPLQYSCLENPMGRGAWWATAHMVSKSWTWMKWFSMHTFYICVVIHAFYKDGIVLHLSSWTIMPYQGRYTQFVMSAQNSSVWMPQNVLQQFSIVSHLECFPLLDITVM